MRQLPIIQIEGTSYYVDERLKEFRNVNNPHERLTLVEAYAKMQGLEVGFCEVCGKVIMLNIQRFKQGYCTSCDHYIKGDCRGASETITRCKDCCEEDFAENISYQDSGFWGEPDTHNEDREETDLP